MKALFIDIWNAFDLIEYQYDRDTHPQVYEAMRQLHMAQLQSKVQDFDVQAVNQAIDQHTVPTDIQKRADAIFEITARKGFLSILGDAFLVNGDKLSGPAASFTGHFGTITQFINDAMTIEEDLREEGHVTPHNLAWLKDNMTHPQHGATQAHYLLDNHLDNLMNQVFHYVNWVFDQPAHRALFDDADSQFNYDSIKSYLTMKLLMTVAKNRAHHSEGFLQHIQRYTPFSLAFLDQLNDLQTQRLAPGGDQHLQKDSLQRLNQQIKADLSQTLRHASITTKLQAAPIVRTLKRALAREQQRKDS